MVAAMRAHGVQTYAGPSALGEVHLTLGPEPAPDVVLERGPETDDETGDEWDANRFGAAGRVPIDLAKWHSRRG
jgi:hypothetical protein